MQFKENEPQFEENETQFEENEPQFEENEPQFEENETVEASGARSSMVVLLQGGMASAA
jgi:hypothetical protein